MGQNITLDAGKSVNITASNLAAKENINLTARDGNVAVVDGTDSASSWLRKQQTGFGLGGGGGFASIYGTEGKRENSASGTSRASNAAAGKDVNIIASRDVAVVGSNINAGANVNVTAGRDVNILAGTNTASASKEKFSAGFGVGGLFSLESINLFAGYREHAEGKGQSASAAVGTQITADKNITITAGQNLNAVGSTVAAGNDLKLAAVKDVNLLQATNTASTSAYERELKAGLTLSLQQNLTSNAKKIYTDAEAASRAKNVLGGMESGLASVNNVGKTLTQSQASVSLTLGVNSSWSNSESSGTAAVPDLLAAGNDLSVTAGQDVRMQGTQALAGRDMTLTAGRDLDIHAGVSTVQNDASGGAWGLGAGIKAAVNKNGSSFSLTAEGKLNNNWSEGAGFFYNNAKLNAGEKLTTVSGRDTAVSGGNLTAKETAMTVGRDLTVQSLQDVFDAAAGQFKAGGSITAGYNANLNMDFSNAAATAKDTTGKANFSTGSSNAQKRWVTDQTSIIGTERVNIYTEGNTAVTGAVVAALNDKLTLNTGSLSYQDLVGKDNSSSLSWGVNWEKTHEWKSEGADKGGKKDQPGTSQQPGKDEDGKVTIPHAPWVDGIVEGQGKLTELWKDAKDELMFAPGDFSYANTAKTQVAYATIGKGEIIVRTDPNASLDGLNRNPAKTTSESQSVTDIKYKAAFGYVDEVLAAKGLPYALKDANELYVDFGSFWNNQWIEVKKGYNGTVKGFKDLWAKVGGQTAAPENAAKPAAPAPQAQGGN